VNIKKPTTIIEHCEVDLSPWIFLEYRHASIIYGRENLLFTNTPAKYHKILSKYGGVRSESVLELIRRNEIKLEEVIVLDPRAHKTLTYQDLFGAKYVVVGGILGDHPPKGRTWDYITSRIQGNIKAFNIGEGQYSIDGAVYYVEYMWRNRDMSGFRYVDGVTLKTDQGEIYLPYRYPLVNNEPLLADGLDYYLKHRKIRDDIWLEIIS
jgi:ribosome biogenesis SPOUT family RNA methylase Rps3